jgi:hypothetical protein
VRPLAPFASFVALGALFVLVFAQAFADGEAVEHAREHAVYSALAAVAAFAVAVRWRAPLESFGGVARAGLAGSICLLAVAQLIEAIGALGYDERDAVLVRDGFDTIHDFGEILTTISLLLVLAAAVLTLVYAATRMRSWRRHPAHR